MVQQLSSEEFSCICWSDRHFLNNSKFNKLVCATRVLTSEKWLRPLLSLYWLTSVRQIDDSFSKAASLVVRKVSLGIHKDKQNKELNIYAHFL